MLVTLIGVAVVVVSLGVLVFLASLLWGAVRVPLGAFVERRQFARQTARAQRADRLLRDGNLDGALAEIEAALYPHPPHSAAMARAIVNHHTGLLSRLMAAADSVQGQRVRLISLAKADRLFHERAALQQRYVALRQSGSHRRLRQLEQEFRANTRELRATLNALAAEIASARTVRYQ
ncbi:MAG: hypothetical protein AB7V27_11075 [Candidatus Binatia bacterium]